MPAPRMRSRVALAALAAAMCLLMAVLPGALPGALVAAVPVTGGTTAATTTTTTTAHPDEALNEIPGIATTLRRDPVKITVEDRKCPEESGVTCRPTDGPTTASSSTRDATHHSSTTREHTATATITKKDLPTASVKASLHPSTQTLDTTPSPRTSPTMVTTPSPRTSPTMVTTPSPRTSPTMVTTPSRLTETPTMTMKTTSGPRTTSVTAGTTVAIEASGSPTSSPVMPVSIPIGASNTTPSTASAATPFRASPSPLRETTVAVPGTSELPAIPSTTTSASTMSPSVSGKASSAVVSSSTEQSSSSSSPIGDEQGTMGAADVRDKTSPSATARPSSSEQPEAVTEAMTSITMEAADPSPAVDLMDKTPGTVSEERRDEFSTASPLAKQAAVGIVRTELGSTTITTDPRTDSSEHGGEVGGEEDVDPLEDGAGLHGDVLEDGDEILMADQPVLNSYLVEIPHFPGDLDAKLGSLDCAVPSLPPQSVLWRSNQTHELELPLTVPVDCKSGADCPAPALGWEATAAMQSGDVLLVRIDNQLLLAEVDKLRRQGLISASAATQSAHHQPQEAVYGVTRDEMANCDVSQGLLLDITPLLVDDKLLLALYDKDLSDGDNFLVILSERWAPSRCVKLHVLMKSDNCGENQDCSGKGVCFSKDTMEGFECQCCPGFLGPHCEEKDACLPSPCLNQGICLDVSQGHEDNQFSCLCPYGFTGDRCEVVTDPCDSLPCRNGGTCQRNGTEWACTCAPDFHGVQCEHSLNPCVPSPCKYGVCVNKDGAPACYCQPGFAGKRCELQFRMCGSMPCLNGGECVDVVDGYSCRCGRGFKGERCEVKVPLCHARSCRPGQICRDLGNNVTCECPPGTAMPDCRPTPAPPRPCASSPCRHGGTCYNSDRGFYCACRPGFTGTTCNVEEAILEEIPVGAAEMAAITSEEHADRALALPLHSVYMGAATLACALLIVVVTVTACHCRVHQTYKRCLVVPCGLGQADARAMDPMAALSSKSTRGQPLGQPLLDPLREPLSALQAPSPLLDASNDVFYALDFSDSQSSPLIQ